MKNRKSTGKYVPVYANRMYSHCGGGGRGLIIITRQPIQQQGDIGVDNTHTHTHTHTHIHTRSLTSARHGGATERGANRKKKENEREQNERRT